MSKNQEKYVQPTNRLGKSEQSRNKRVVGKDTQRTAEADGI
jgi:hypothetical protein